MFDEEKSKLLKGEEIVAEVGPAAWRTKISNNKWAGGRERRSRCGQPGSPSTRPRLLLNHCFVSCMINIHQEASGRLIRGKWNCNHFTSSPIKERVICPLCWILFAHNTAWTTKSWFVESLQALNIAKAWHDRRLNSLGRPRARAARPKTTTHYK